MHYDFDWIQSLGGRMGKEQRLKEATMETSAGPKDARGRVLEEGDEIILNVKGPLYFRVAEIHPALEPGAPPDMIYVHVGAMIPFMCKRGAINPEFIRVRTLSEAGPTNFQVDRIMERPAPPAPPGQVTE